MSGSNLFAGSEIPETGLVWVRRYGIRSLVRADLNFEGACAGTGAG